MWAKVEHAYTRNTQTNTAHPPTPRPPVGDVMTNWCTNMLVQDQVHQAGGYCSVPCAATDIIKWDITLSALGQLYTRIRNINHEKWFRNIKSISAFCLISILRELLLFFFKGDSFRQSHSLIVVLNILIFMEQKYCTQYSEVNPGPSQFTHSKTWKRVWRMSSVLWQICFNLNVLLECKWSACFYSCVWVCLQTAQNYICAVTSVRAESVSICVCQFMCVYVRV